MKNIIYNKIEIQGPIEKIKPYIINNKNQVDFNLIIPQPKELQVIGDINSEENLALDIQELYETNQIEKLQEIASNLLDKPIEKKYVMFYFQPIYNKSQKIDQEQFKEKRCENLVLALIEKYHAKDIYNWSEKNWSVPENATNTKINQNIISFQTKDNPPQKYYKKLREKLNQENIEYKIITQYTKPGALLAQEETIITKEKIITKPITFK